MLLLYSRPVMSNSLWPRGLQHSRLPCLSLSPGVCSNSCPLSWCHPTISAFTYEEPTHRKRPGCWERLRAGGEGETKAEMVGGIDSMDMSLSKLQEPNCRKELDMTGRLDNNNIIKYGCWDMSVSKLRELVMSREALAHWHAMPWVTKSSVPDPGVLSILLGHLAKC